MRGVSYDVNSRVIRKLKQQTPIYGINNEKVKNFKKNVNEKVSYVYK